jgi:hypothetical protein
MIFYYTIKFDEKYGGYQMSLSRDSAEIWYLEHSGFAVRTSEHF